MILPGHDIVGHRGRGDTSRRICLHSLGWRFLLATGVLTVPVRSCGRPTLKSRIKRRRAAVDMMTKGSKFEECSCRGDAINGENVFCVKVKEARWQGKRSNL
jgi:hypothetical protein